MNKFTISQRISINSFQKSRSDFYDDLSSLLMSTDKKIIDIFSIDAERYAGTPRGVISGIWLQRLDENGADLANAWYGTLPDEEVSVLSVQQNGGANAIAIALKDMGRMAKLTELVVSETKKTVGAAVIALLIGTGAVTIFPVFAVDMLKESLEMPTSAWGSSGRALAAWVDIVNAWSIPVGLGFIFTSALVWWSIKNWTGPWRARADRSIVLYRTLRDLSAVRFLDTMSTLARKRGNIMETLNVALNQMAEQTPSRWSRWRLNQVLSRIEQTGATTCEVFDTGIISKAMFWRLRDVEESRGFADAFHLTAEYVSATLVPRLIKQLVVWRWVMMIIAVAMAAGMVLWMQATSAEMKNAVMNYTTG